MYTKSGIKLLWNTLFQWTNQIDFNAYNYIQFDDEDIVPVKLDRIDEVEISIMTRKGDLINFVDHHDVKCQLEFKQIV